MLQRKLVQLIAVIVILGVAAACTPTAEAPTATLAAQAPSTQAAAATEGPAPTTDPPAGAPTETRVAAEPTESGELPLGDPSLKASDPTAVNLSAGHPQLVEFFAFW